MAIKHIEGPEGRLVADIADGGSGHPIVFVHSDGGTRHHWDDIRRRLKHRTTIAFDRRGHGRSDPPRNGSFVHPQGAEDIIAVADQLGLHRFVLVAHSGGAGNAFALAGTYPRRICGLLLLDPLPDPAALPRGLIEHQLEAIQSSYENTVGEYYRSIAGSNAAVTALVLKDALATPSSTIVGTIKALATFEPAQYAARIPTPALAIVQASNDTPGALHRLAPGFPHITIDGAGHWIHLGAPDEFARVFSNFLLRTG